MVTSGAVNRENVVSVAKGVLESLSEPKWPASEPTGRKSSMLVAGEYRAPYSMGADEGEPEDASASSSGGLSSTERFSILTGCDYWFTLAITEPIQVGQLRDQWICNHYVFLE